MVLAEPEPPVVRPLPVAKQAVVVKLVLGTSTAMVKSATRFCLVWSTGSASSISPKCVNPCADCQLRNKMR